MIELFLLLLFVILISAGAYFYYLSAARQPFRRDDLSAFEWSQHYLLEGDWNAAARELSRAAKEDPDNIFARVRLGEVIRRQGDLERALRIHLELTIREQLTQRERIALNKALADDYEASGAPEKALAHLEQILTLDKDHSWALARKLPYLANKGDWTAYLETSKRLAGIRNQPPDSRRLAIVCTLDGDRLQAAGKLKEGRLRYREAIKYDPTFPGSYIGLAESYRREKRISDALTEIEQLVETAPDQADVAFPTLESILYEQGRFDEVEDFYRKFLRHNRHIARGYTALAAIVERKGETATALQILHEGIEANPDNDLLRYETARLLTRLGQVDELVKMGLEVMRKLALPSSGYSCKKCGFAAEAMRWFCPSCGAWDSFNA